MSDFNSRFMAAYQTNMKPDDESDLNRTMYHMGRNRREGTYNEEMLKMSGDQSISRIDSSFPSQGTPQGSHEGSQSTVPNKEFQ